MATNAVLRLEIQPKRIDTDDNEQDLTAYSVSALADTFQEYTFSIATSTGVTETTLPTVTSTKVIEFISDVAVTFKVYESNGSSLIDTFDNCKYWCTMSDMNLVLKVLNNSGSTATITVRQGK